MKNTLSRKAKLFILSVLMPLSMMSIGFSSWTITAVKEVNGSFTTETVSDTSAYITSCEVEYFDYMSTGFVTLPENTSSNTMLSISDTGYITTTLTIDLENCRNSNVFDAGDNLQVQVELFNSQTVSDDKGNTLSLFPYFTTAEYAANNSSATTINSRSLDATKATAAFTFMLDETTQSVTYTIRFEFNATRNKESIFKAEVYPILQAMKAHGVSMVVQVSIMEVPK